MYSWNSLRPAFLLLLMMTLLTGLIYPLCITIIAQLTMPHKANGSLLLIDEKVIGSSLIGQNFKKDEYFHPRPSAVDFDPLKPAGGSNLGPTSKELQIIVQERVKQFSSSPPAELVYASGSGLDPHLSIDAIRYQFDRVAKARAISDLKQFESLIISMTEGLTHKYINVLVLNQTIDKKYPMNKPHEQRR